MKDPYHANHHAGDDGHGPERVRDAAMVLELLDRPGESPEDIEIGSLGGQHRGQSGVGRLAVESGAANAGAGEEMGDGFHKRLLSCIENDIRGWTRVENCAGTAQAEPGAVRIQSSVDFIGRLRGPYRHDATENQLDEEDNFDYRNLDCFRRCSRAARQPAGASFGPGNPFYAPSTLPFQAPPFDKIKDSDYQPAIDAGMAQQIEEVEAIANNPAPPTFENTLVALERSGQLLDRVWLRSTA